MFIYWYWRSSIVHCYYKSVRVLIILRLISAIAFEIKFHCFLSFSSTLLHSLKNNRWSAWFYNSGRFSLMTCPSPLFCSVFFLEFIGLRTMHNVGISWKIAIWGIFSSAFLVLMNVCVWSNGKKSLKVEYIDIHSNFLSNLWLSDSQILQIWNFIINYC